MYRILLVDDELAVLNGLCKTIPWAEYGFETVAQASNGVQALSMLQQQQFDILLTDISMPDMDGLTLLKTARVLYPDMRCIILTAYSEFDYVLQALRLGVDNFLLKPLNPAELISTIQQSLKRIESPFISADESTGTFRCNILTRWMTGTLSVEELDSHAESAGINLFCRNYNIVSLKPLTGSIETKATCETLLKALAAYFDCYTVTDEYNCTFFILGGHSITTDNLYPLLKPFVRDNFHIFIGQTVDNCSLLSACYQELQQTTLYAAMFSTDEPVCIDTLRQKTAQFKGSGYLGSLPDLLHNLKQPDISTQFSHLLYDFLEHITPSEYIFAVIAYLDILLVKLKQSHLSQELLTDFLTATVETLLPLNNKKDYQNSCFIYSKKHNIL